PPSELPRSDPGSNQAFSALPLECRNDETCQDRYERAAVILESLVRPNSGHDPGSRSGAGRYGVCRQGPLLPVRSDLIGRAARLPKADVEIRRTGKIAPRESGGERATNADGGGIKRDASDYWLCDGDSLSVRARGVH